jgi:hypothetical protein
MADFSKQYCELHDMGFDGDFDIMEEYHKLTPGNYVPYICEGYGFIAIGKFDDTDESCMLAMPVDDTSYGTVVWKLYEQIVK